MRKISCRKWFPTAVIAVAVAGSACQGKGAISIEPGTVPGESPYGTDGAPEQSGDSADPTEDEDAYLHPVGQTPETDLDQVDPNSLPQEDLFQCDPETVSSSPSRVRRITGRQFVERWGTSTALPYAPSGQFRYSTDERDGRIDDGTADQIVTRALRLGVELNERRIGWPRCMRHDILGDARPDRSCVEEWAPGWLSDAWERDATSAEVTDFADFTEAAMDEFGTARGLELAAAQPYADPRFMFRVEIAEGELDEHGRMRLDSWQIAHAITLAITDRPLSENRVDKGVDRPLAEATNALAAAAEAGELTTRALVETHVRAMLDAQLATGDDGELILPINLARFFREYIGHGEAEFVFKNGGETPGGQKDYKYYKPAAFADSTDATIAMLFQDDSDFLDQLLTTRDYWLPGTKAWPYNLSSMDNDESERDVGAGVVTFPEAERAGLVTHPGWLAAHSGNQHVDPHPVHRGKWVLENLLCTPIPDLPLTVDAQMPDMPSKSVRERLEAITDPTVSEDNAYCAQCHGLMNPLGVPFEQYSHYGRWRDAEMVADGSLVPVDATTTLPELGDPVLDGAQVRDAVEMMELFADSERVEGCFVRQTFRYFAGRSETQADACTLSEMRETYRASGGSFKEMLVELLTSDTMLYRHVPTEEQEESQ